jgi:predicted glycoside hydrolase/deacetylase ChbG (UPF0249 family)
MTIPAHSLRITADDYGLSASVNAGIEQLARQGAISAASVMCHADAELGTAHALADSKIATGLHLVLVEERPRCPQRLEPLLDAYGNLPRTYTELFAALVRRPSLARLLCFEADAQLERYRSLGLPLNFINSHQHVHLFPPLWSALAPLFESCPGARVRSPAGFVFGGVKQRVLGAVASIAERVHRLGRERLIVPLGIDFAGQATLDSCRELLEALAGATCAGSSQRTATIIEMVMHPGLPDHATLNRYCRWKYNWKSEHDLLASSALRDLMVQHGFSAEGIS